MTQKERIYNYMQDFGSITPIQAFTDLGITKLATRISEMKRDGVLIEQQMIKVKNRYGDKTEVMKYSLQKSESVVS